MIGVLISVPFILALTALSLPRAILRWIRPEPSAADTVTAPAEAESEPVPPGARRTSRPRPEPQFRSEATRPFAYDNGVMTGDAP